MHRTGRGRSYRIRQHLGCISSWESETSPGDEKQGLKTAEAAAAQKRYALLFRCARDVHIYTPRCSPGFRLPRQLFDDGVHRLVVYFSARAKIRVIHCRNHEINPSRGTTKSASGQTVGGSHAKGRWRAPLPDALAVGREDMS